MGNELAIISCSLNINGCLLEIALSVTPILGSALLCLHPKPVQANGLFLYLNFLASKQCQWFKASQSPRKNAELYDPKENESEGLVFFLVF